MKPTLATNGHPAHTGANNPNNLCESTDPFSSFSLPQLPAFWFRPAYTLRPYLSRLQAKWPQSWRQLFAPAYRAAVTGLAVPSKALKSNRHLLYAAYVMLVGAPLASVAYQLFSPTARIEGWYYLNFYYLLYTLGPHLFTLLTLVGVFLLFPAGRKRAWLLVGPAGYVVAKIVWLCTVSSNQQFHQVIPYSVLLLGMLGAFSLLMCAHWLCHRQFHRHDAFAARVLSLTQCPGLDAATRQKLLRKVLAETKQYNAKEF